MNYREQFEKSGKTAYVGYGDDTCPTDEFIEFILSQLQARDELIAEKDKEIVFLNLAVEAAITDRDYYRDKIAKKDELIEKAISEAKEIHPYKQAGNPDSFSVYNAGWFDACEVISYSIKKGNL